MAAKKTLTAVVVVLIASVLPIAHAGPTDYPRSKTLPRQIASPLGQVLVVNVNAKQTKVLGVPRFRRLLALTETLLSRPPGFNGGYTGALIAPDVILLQEMRSSNVEILEKMLNQRSRFEYGTIGAEQSNRRILYNSSTLTPDGEPVVWNNPCRVDEEGIPKSYLRGRFIEQSSGVPFTTASVHFPKTTDCKQANIIELRSQLSGDSDAVIVGGDFNARPVEQYLRCDVNELSAPRRWYTMMVAPDDGGRAYVDAVRETNRRDGKSMADEWTHAGKKSITLCDGSTGRNHSRIDYLFAAGVTVAEAHSDNASAAPGATPYSDHRFVWGRFALSALQRPETPDAVARKGGVVRLTWIPVSDATGYVVFRAVGDRPYTVRAQLDADTLTFDDGSTQHARRYRYAVAATDAAGMLGVESSPAYETADARGPRVKSVLPPPGARFVPRNASARIRFDEPVAADSAVVELRRKGRALRGRLIRESGRVLTFNPKRRLQKHAVYELVVRGAKDRLGNVGDRFAARFST